LRYMPSMRNGQHRSDRGNALLSTVAIGAARGFVLPYIKQRRVVVNAELQGLDSVTFVSAHLDTGGRLRGGGRRCGEGRAAQSVEMVRRLQDIRPEQSYVIGADLNTALGARDPAFLVFTRAGLQRAAGSQLIKHTFHGPVRLLLDHVLYHTANDNIKRVEVTRLDEHERDRRSPIFGSDHHPLLARVILSD